MNKCAICKNKVSKSNKCVGCYDFVKCDSCGDNVCFKCRIDYHHDDVWVLTQCRKCIDKK